MNIDIENYLQDITPDTPCGEDLEYDPEFIQLEQEIKGKPEIQIGDTIQEAEPPVWRDIIKQCENLLSRTRDLRVLINYFRALAATEGFIGVAKGLELINRLVEAQWENIYPILDPDDDNDPTERINILMALCDFETSLKPLQSLILIESKAIGRFNFRDVQIAEGKMTPVKVEEEGENASLSDIESAAQDCDITQLKTTLEAVNISLDFLNKTENFITDKVGVVDAPSFAELRTLLQEISLTMKSWLELRGEEEEVETNEEVESLAPEESVKTVTVKKVSEGINNTQDVLKALKQVCEYYRKHEPSSPIPLLLERVIGLVGKDFLDVLKDIAPNGVEQVEFLRGSSNKEE